MRLQPAAIPSRIALLALASVLVTGLGGCSTIGGWFSSDQADYKKTPVRPQSLEVPPDLSQLARDSRYQVQGGVISAAAAASGPAAAAPAAAASAPPGVAISSEGALRVVRDGQMRWLVVPLAPEAVWPRLEQFWKDRGATLTTDDAKAGVMETDWIENKDKRPDDFIRSTIGKLLPNLFDSGFRDRYRTRVERTATGSEVYVTHRGLEDVSSVSEQNQSTGWRATPPDPQAEATILSAMLVALGSKDEQARLAVASAPQTTPKAEVASPGQSTSIVIDDNFDRAWRRVGLVLDRGGFTVEDRDRAAGIYYVRWVDPKNAGKEEPGWWARLWGDHSNPQEALRYRIVLKGRDDKSTLLTVQNSAGVADTGDNARGIASLLVKELR